MQIPATLLAPNDQAFISMLARRNITEAQLFANIPLMQCILNTNMVPGIGRLPPQLDLGNGLTTYAGTQLFVSLTRGRLNVFSSCTNAPDTTFVIGVPQSSGPGLQVRACGRATA